MSDKKVGVDANTDGTIDSYVAEVRSAQDYYPFGMLMPGRRGYLQTGGSSSGSAGGGSGSGLPVDLGLSERNGNQPAEYKATNSIEFVDGFVSGSSDEFVAYITDQILGGSGGSGSYNWVMDGNAGYRYGFNGKEDDNEVKGEGNQQDYGIRIYDLRLGRFMSVDALSKDYPYLTPYQFASNSPISGIDLDGLEYYYAADGKFLGQGNNPENKEVRLGKIIGTTKTNKNLISAVDINGQVQSQWTIIHSNHDDFKSMAGILYAEADGTTTSAVDEVAGIYSVLENRAKYEKTSVQEQMTVAKGVYGANATETNKINQADKVGMTTKKEAVFAGLIKGVLSETDFSNGAFYWDGKDFNKDAKPNGGYKQRYVPGYLFTESAHDLFNQGNNKKPGTANGITWDYKYKSTGARGKTTFSKLADEWKDAQYPGAAKAKEVGTGKE